MNQANYKPIDPPPILLDSKAASRACSMSVSLWNSLSSAGQTPQPVKLSSKKQLWDYRTLCLWSLHGCKSRTSPEWLDLLEKLRSNDT